MLFFRGVLGGSSQESHEVITQFFTMEKIKGLYRHLKINLKLIFPFKKTL